MKVSRIYSILLLSGLLVFFAGMIQQTHAGTRIVEVRIPGCICEGTDQAVFIVVSRIPGVKSVETFPIAQSARIEFDDEVTNLEKIRDALTRENLTIVGKPKWIK